ncbi:MAG: TolB-like 6-bladed beta-propeller domain-containing protein, partial [Tannerellaceae bacterium]|nr:TolB-like 6-bladed beta-propeller domain-containing protein [Tannerellaceae bacterium]
EGYLHIIDLKTGQESGPFIQIGQGPEEFTMPQLVKSHHQHVIVYDHLTDKIAWLDMNQTGTSSFIRHSHNEITREANRIVEIEDGEFLTLNTTQEPIFFFKGQRFGVNPFTEKAENLVDLLQGNLLYNPQKKLLVYATMRVPYIASYKRQGDHFTLLWEKKEDTDYELVNNRIKIDESRRGPMELALTKDYIVTLQRDYSKDPTNESTVGRDFSKLPQTLFVYNYKSELVRILDFKVPIVRIAADVSTNTVYAIVVDPDFRIVKLDIN